MRCTRVGKVRPSIFVKDIATIPPGAVVDPAGIRPATADPVAAGSGVGDAASPQGTGYHGIGRAVDLARALLRQERCPNPVSGADHKVPGSRGVCLSHGLDDLHRCDRVGFQTAISDGHVHPEKTRLVHRRQHASRQSPFAFALDATIANHRAEVTRSGDQIGCLGLHGVH